MVSVKWNVEDALNEVVEKIRWGSSLSIAGLEQGYKDRYYCDFKGHWDADPYDSWPGAKDRILKLARLVGHLATMLTKIRAIISGKPDPTTVEPYSAYMAGYIVAKVICPPGSPGVWCMGYYFMEDASDTAQLDSLAAEFGAVIKEAAKYLPDTPPGGAQ
jgi:hypothetical protein